MSGEVNRFSIVRPPLVHINDTGEVVLEWWYGTKKVTMYIDGEITVLQMEGESIEDSLVQAQQDIITVFDWLIS